jgi:hypothetical protein
MNSFWFSWIMSYSILIAAFIGILRYSSVHENYKPFIWIIWLGAFNELLSTVLIMVHRSNTINGNLYVLAEVTLFAYLFYSWRQLSRKEMVMLLSFVTAAWITDNFFWHKITTINSAFRVVASFVLGFLAIGQINILLQEHKNLIRNGRFLICLAMLIFFSYKSFVEVFYAIPFKMTPGFYQKTFAVLVIINFVSNILYALATLCLPSKPQYMLRSS